MRLGLLAGAVAVLSTMTGCESAESPEPVPATATAAPPGINPDLAPIPDLDSDKLTKAWEKLSKTKAEPGGQTSVRFPGPGGKGEVFLGWVVMPGQPGSVTGMVCQLQGKPTPHGRAAVTALFGQCLPQGVADGIRAEIASWLTSVRVGDSLAKHRFDGYNVVVEHLPAGSLGYGPSRPPGRDGSVLHIYLTGGDKAPTDHR